MNNQERTLQLKLFRERNDIEAFVVSIEAGGVGLNMTCADEVYMMVCRLPLTSLKDTDLMFYDNDIGCPLESTSGSASY